ncbi:uncharacterized protein DFL_002113 [Arthrobotrys flagrans]|uniref:Uncharacterized protein n=1 Tax=Arthrobotrys flagrans TaxID=97331 RepID=A0A437AAJ6_ARTFL|nr:hypothetical protein DFL_002113 [Arthrobotrys flagrans]
MILTSKPSFAVMKRALEEAVSSERHLFLQFDAEDQPLADEFITLYVLRNRRGSVYGISSKLIPCFCLESELNENSDSRISYNSYLRNLSIERPHYIHECTGDFVTYLWESWKDAQLLPPNAADLLCRLSSPSIFRGLDSNQFPEITQTVFPDLLEEEDDPVITLSGL